MTAAEAIFYGAAILTALDYLLIGSVFLNRIRVGFRGRKTNPKALRATAYLVTFFFGCVHTHLNLVLLPGLHSHWFAWPDVLSHVLQALGGLGFWWSLRHHLILNIFDRQEYRRATGEFDEANARLDVLAMRYGLVKR